mgnify:CR=1 FL=1
MRVRVRVRVWAAYGEGCRGTDRWEPSAGDMGRQALLYSGCSWHRLRSSHTMTMPVWTAQRARELVHDRVAPPTTS